MKNFFSGVEGEQHYNAAIDAGAQHVLMSFLYLEKKKDFDIVRRRKKANPKIKFLIDSGAHTFQTGCHDAYSSWKVKDYEDFLIRYVAWLEKNIDVIDAAVELDIDYPLSLASGQDPKTSTIGTSIVEGWQKKYFKPLAEKGLEICYVWHKERGFEKWEQMCQEFSYVGLPGEFSARPDFNKYITVARRYSTKVHGFAATKQTDFKDWPWFSVDSTTWKSSEIYGTLIHWDVHAQKFMFIEDKSRRGEFRAPMIKAGVNADLIIKDGLAVSDADKKAIRAEEARIGVKAYREITKYALYSMSEMEKFYQRMYAERTFYYELRLPHPKVVAKWAEKTVKRWYTRFKPEDTFEDHKITADYKSIRKWLLSIAAVQNNAMKEIQGDKECFGFINRYLGDAVVNLEVSIVQKELANVIAPTNPIPLERTETGHWDNTNNPPKFRDEESLALNEIVVDPLEHYTITEEEL